MKCFFLKGMMRHILYVLCFLSFLATAIASPDSQNTAQLLNNVPSTYASSIQDALSTIVSEEEMQSIEFKSLLGGLSQSKLFQFDLRGKKYVLRLLDENKALERRKSEVAAHRIASQLEIAPKLFYTDRSPLVMIMEFIEGRTFSREDLDNRDLVTQVMQTLKKFHQYTGDAHLLKRTKVETIEYAYERHKAKGTVFPSCFEKLLDELQEEASNLDARFGPSHGDFNPNNIMVGDDGKIYIIDWSEACIDHPFFDIGWLSNFSAVSTDQIENLLKGYLERDPTESEIEEVLFHKGTTTLLVAVHWLGKQEERDQNTLDSILAGQIKSSSEYIKEGVTTIEVSKKTGHDLTVYSLGWLKEFLQNKSAKSSLTSHYEIAQLQASKIGNSRFYQATFGTTN